MIRGLILPLLLLLPTSWAIGDEAPQPKAKVPTAIVRPDKCVFTFPVADIKRVWKWGVSPANLCEYSWMVTVKGGDDATYQLGFSYFNPQAIPQSGTINGLLSTGQANVWKLAAAGNGASYVEGVEVSCQSTDDALRISIDNKKWIKELFGRAPEFVRFETSGTRLEAGKENVKVVYKKTAEKHGK